MFHNRTIGRKILYSTGTLVLGILAVVIAVVLYMYIQYKRTNNKKLEDNISRYAEQIYDYSLSIQTMDDQAASLIIDTYKWQGDVVLSVSQTDAAGNDVPDYAWNTNAEAFLEVILKIQEMMVLTSISTSKHYENTHIWDIVINFVDKVMSKIPLPPQAYKFPWGQNWYQFSITFPRFLVIASYLYYRIFNKQNTTLQSHLSNYINNYFQNPTARNGVVSMGWLRDGPNAVMMTVPYIGGKLLMKTYDENDAILEYTRNYISLKDTTSGEGIYPDGGFVFHSTLRAYGYIYSAYQDFFILSRFFNMPIDKIQNIFDIFEHPTIPLHFSAFFTRSGSLSSGQSGRLGFFVVDSIKAVIAKTPNWYLGFNGQTTRLCFYEADGSNKSWGQLWLMCRQFLYADSESKWIRDFVPYYPGVISFDNAIQDMPTTTTTTTTFPPNDAKCMICYFDSAIGIRNEYSVTHELFDLSVVEFMLITNQGYHVFYRIKPNATRQATEPIRVSVNFGGYIQGASVTGLGTGYKFEKSTSFVYDDKKNNVITSVKHPTLNKTITSLQVVPPLDRTSGQYVDCSFSTIHSDINECAAVPTLNVIKTNEYILHYEDDNENFMWLYDLTTKRAAVTNYRTEYSDVINIPSSMLTFKFGAEVLKDLVIFNGKASQSTKTFGNQIILRKVSPPQSIK